MQEAGEGRNGKTAGSHDDYAQNGGDRLKGEGQ